MTNSEGLTYTKDHTYKKYLILNDQKKASVLVFFFDVSITKISELKKLPYFKTRNKRNNL